MRYDGCTQQKSTNSHWPFNLCIYFDIPGIRFTVLAGIRWQIEKSKVLESGWVSNLLFRSIWKHPPWIDNRRGSWLISVASKQHDRWIVLQFEWIQLNENNTDSVIAEKLIVQKNEINNLNLLFFQDFGRFAFKISPTFIVSTMFNSKDACGSSKRNTISSMISCCPASILLFSFSLR